jgi:hypothetical protein
MPLAVRNEATRTAARSISTNDQVKQSSLVGVGRNHDINEPRIYEGEVNLFACCRMPSPHELGASVVDGKGFISPER